MRYFLVLFFALSTANPVLSKELSDKEVCDKIFYSNMHQVDKLLNIAKQRNLSCGVVNNNVSSNKKHTNSINSRQIPVSDISDKTVCKNATLILNGNKIWDKKNDVFVGEAYSRGLDCGVSASIYFKKLNPTLSAKIKKPNILALVVGIEKYESSIGKAIYAENDSKAFKEFAKNKLGIFEHNIKYLGGSKADEKAILLSVKKWLRRSIKKGITDIYIFFAGHGLATDNGKDLFLLPYDGSPELLEETSISRAKLFKDISSENPRSVTVFLDTCYSGTTRGTDMLIASRPIFIPTKEQSIPDNFTVFSAAAGDQTSKPLEEAKHGMFSYFLMKGMEGDADANNDKKITALELHNYVRENVVQQSSGSQTPELQGDADRVLVQFN
jgi:hypothetical protein